MIRNYLASAAPECKEATIIRIDLTWILFDRIVNILQSNILVVITWVTVYYIF